MARSTMNNLFHRAGEVLAPLARRLLALIAQRKIVLADETPMPRPMPGHSQAPIYLDVHRLASVLVFGACPRAG